MPPDSATVRSIGVVAVLALALAGAFALPAAAVEAQGISVDPSEPSVLGQGAVLRPAIPPGASATYSLTVRNSREVPVEVLVYGADITDTGQVASGADNQAVGGWVTTDQASVAVEPMSSEAIDVTITRPADDTDGGTGAIVVQLSEASRQELGLEVVRRAALRVAVAADGSGAGIVGEIVQTDTSTGLLPGVLTAEVRYTRLAGNKPVLFDGTLVLSRPFGDDPRYDAAGGELRTGGEVTSRPEVELPWYGVVGTLRAEAAVPGLTTSSPPVRVVVVPPWLALVLVVAAAVAVQQMRSRQSFGFGSDPDGGSGDAQDDATDATDAADAADAGDAGDDPR